METRLIVEIDLQSFENMFDQAWAIFFDALFFSFLAAITFPHAFVILKMFKK
jgi:hypothetical protein